MDGLLAIPFAISTEWWRVYCYLLQFRFGAAR